MNIWREVPPTAGFPVSLRDCLRPGRVDRDSAGLEEDFKAYLPAAYARLVSSGTAALYVILEAFKNISPKRRVILPAYICPSVAQAVARAGLKIELCDTHAYDFNLDLDALARLLEADRDVLAVVTAHLAGIPADWEGLRKITAAAGALVIEDCAQALGAAYRGQKVGTLGDAAFFSLARGKGLTIYEGGVMVTARPDLAAAIDTAADRLVRPDRGQEAVKILELLGYAIFYRPQLFWFVYQLPELFWRLTGQAWKAKAEDFAPDFPVHAVSSWRDRVGHAAFYRLERELAAQRQKAADYIALLADIPGIKIVREAAGDTAGYPFLTILFDDPVRRKKFLYRLEYAGRGVSTLYSRPLSGYDYLRGLLPPRACPQAQALADCQVTLSTSTFLWPADMALIADTLRKIG